MTYNDFLMAIKIAFNASPTAKVKKILRVRQLIIEFGSAVNWRMFLPSSSKAIPKNRASALGPDETSSDRFSKRHRKIQRDDWIQHGIVANKVEGKVFLE